MHIIKDQSFEIDGLYLKEPTKVVGCKFFNIHGFNHHAMELHGDGTKHNEPQYIIEDCVIDNRGIKPSEEAYDEGVAVLNSAYVIFNRVRFKNLGKSCLVGNGDYPETDKNLYVIFNECIFENCGRRNPYIQFGSAILNNCLIKNWGDPDYFYKKSFGVRVGPKAMCIINDTVFWQDKFWPGFKNFVTDITSQYDPILLPGNFRAAYAENGGILTLSNCYRNSKLLYFDGKLKSEMSKSEALEKINHLETIVPKLD